MRPSFLPLVLIVLAGQSNATDQPLRTNRVVCAIEAPICARANVQTNTTVVSRSDSKTRTQETLWSFPAWLRVARINESGEALLVEAEEFNQLPPDAPPELVVLRLYTRSSLGREFKLQEFFASEMELQSARRLGAWAKALGSENSDVAKYLLASGRRVRITLSTAEVTFE